MKLNKLTKAILNSLIVTFIIACSQQKNISNHYLEGVIIKDDLMTMPFQKWFLQEFNSYKPVVNLDSNYFTTDKLKNALEGKKIEVYMGTWCEDSQREVPRFIKFCEKINFTNYIIYGLNTNKKSNQGFEKNKKIIRVPTFIVLNKNKRELNRIIEYPVHSIEKDLYIITTEKAYSPNYSK